MEQLKDLLDRLPYSMILVGALAYIGYGFYQFKNSPNSSRNIDHAGSSSSIR